jgi:ATP-dependent helicase HepA
MHGKFNARFELKCVPMNEFLTGQKWISIAEPELGMGQIDRVEPRRVSVLFPVSQELRTYTSEHAPLTRVRFNPGDTIKSIDDTDFVVSDVQEQNGLLYYSDANGIVLKETSLKDDLQFSNPQDRLFTGQFDETGWFHLRYQALTHQANLLSASARGLFGPKLALIPHQLFISHEVANRFAPRVLLADEVGLGKTIEAGLILHQQIHTGRVQRALIVVPPALKFQWFVEMIRRFNFQFTILDEDRCQQIEHDNDDGYDFNPFHAQQLVLCSLELFTSTPKRVRQAVDGNWDLLVVDEAHHLIWTENMPGPEYQVIEQIARSSRGVLLLTATPEQLGRSGHFARLRLLDPDRFYDYQTFLDEEAAYEPIAELANELLSDDQDRQNKARRDLSQLLSMDSHQELSHREFIELLVDRHGTGRVLFRNVRSSVQGFSNRILHAQPLEYDGDYLTATDDVLLSLYPEVAYREALPGNKTNKNTSRENDWLSKDPRPSWLDRLLSGLKGQKCLVICADSQTAIELDEWLSNRRGHKSSVFHEGMDLVSRDRSAAYFAEINTGAHVLVCSEIGSEGRNFQFAHHLVLFDLPANPDLLEQRIGRLDRIGQQHDVQIHVPYLKNTAQELIFRWYHQGMNLFNTTNPAALSLFEQQFATWIELLVECRLTGALPDSFEKFLAETNKLCRSKLELLSRGRDRLLELNSHDERVSGALIEEIRCRQGGNELEAFMSMVFEKYGLEVEPVSDLISLLKPTEGMARHDVTSIETHGRYRFPELPEEGVPITFDRDTALAREEVSFMTWENPIVTQALELLITDVMGNCCICVIKHPKLKRGTMLLESLHRFETVAPGHLQLELYLPPRIIRSLVLADGTNIANEIEYDSFESLQVDVNTAALYKVVHPQLATLRTMQTRANEYAQKELQKSIEQAQSKMQGTLESEIERLEQLAEINPNIRQDEIDYLGRTRMELGSYIRRASSRLDAIRIIIAA